MELHGRTALITGAAKRIGRAIALALAEGGADIVVHYRSSRREALALKDEINSLGVKAYLVSSDFSFPKKSVESEAKRLVRKVYKLVSSVDILVNNASNFYPSAFGRIREKEWDDLMAVNLKAPFFLSQEIGARMVRKKSGKIINLVDWAGFRPYKDYLPYSISKAGLIAATKGLAKVLAPHVQVIGIAPGPILAAKGMTSEQMKAATDRTLLKRIGDPGDIARTVLFAVRDTDFMTGAVIPVEGGALNV